VGHVGQVGQFSNCSIIKSLASRNLPHTKNAMWGMWGTITVARPTCPTPSFCVLRKSGAAKPNRNKDLTGTPHMSHMPHGKKMHCYRSVAEGLGRARSQGEAAIPRS
jgi:hypothetical protein